MNGLKKMMSRNNVTCGLLRLISYHAQFIQALSLMKEGEDAFKKIGEALNIVDKKQITSDISMPTIKSPEQNQVNGSVSITSKPMATAGWASNPKLQEASKKNEEQVPSELITSCVSTLLMIQVKPRIGTLLHTFFLLNFVLQFSCIDVLFPCVLIIFSCPV